MKKIIISGATSMLGCELTKYAIKNDYEAYCIIRPFTSRINRLDESDKIHFIYSNLDELSSIKDLPTDCFAFFHFAWDGTRREDRENAVIHSKNIQFTLDAVDLAKRCGCYKFVFAGSQAEYGKTEGIINENTITQPESAYGIAKYTAGMLSKKMCSSLGIEHIWARVFSVYGPHDNSWTMIISAINNWEKGKITSFSKATQIWNYLYEEDAAKMFLRMADEDVKSGLYLVANPDSCVLKEYIDILRKEYGDGAEAVFSSDEKGLKDLNVDISYTNSILNIQNFVSFEKGIRNTIDFLK